MKSLVFLIELALSFINCAVRSHCGTDWTAGEQLLERAVQVFRAGVMVCWMKLPEANMLTPPQQDWLYQPGQAGEPFVPRGGGVDPEDSPSG